MLENANIFRHKDTQIDTETQSKKVAGGYTIIDFCINLRRFFSAGDGMSAKFSVTAIACHT